MQILQCWMSGILSDQILFKHFLEINLRRLAFWRKKSGHAVKITKRFAVFENRMIKNSSIFFFFKTNFKPMNCISELCFFLFLTLLVYISLFSLLFVMFSLSLSLSFYIFSFFLSLRFSFSQFLRLYVRLSRYLIVSLHVYVSICLTSFSLKLYLSLLFLSLCLKIFWLRTFVVACSCTTISIFFVGIVSIFFLGGGTLSIFLLKLISITKNHQKVV